MLKYGDSEFKLSAMAGPTYNLLVVLAVLAVLAGVCDLDWA